MLTQGVIGVKQQLKILGSAILISRYESGKLTQLTDYKDGCLPRGWSPTGQQIVATCSYSHPYNAEGVSGPETVRIFDIESPVSLMSILLLATVTTRLGPPMENKLS